MKKVAITLGLTNNIAFAAGTTLFGLKDNPPKISHDVIIYETDLSEKNKRLLNQIYPCIFKKFDTSKIKSNRFKRLSKMAFSRYESFSLLENYSTVLWLDVDILIKGDITPLLTSIDSEIAMFRHKDIPIKNSLKRKAIQKCNLKYDIECDVYNSGILLLNDNIKNPEKIKQWFYEAVNKFSDCISGDQEVINFALQEFNIQIQELAEKYNCFPKREKVVRECSIIHPWGDEKFWNKRYNSQWDYCYKKWQEIGGDGPKLPHPIIRWFESKKGKKLDYKKLGYQIIQWLQYKTPLPYKFLIKIKHKLWKKK